MASFKDAEGREWIVSIDVPILKVVRERCKFELGKVLMNEMAGLKQLASEPELLADVLYVLCKEQADKKPVTPEQFGRALKGDAIENGFDALMGAYADFCPSRQANPLRALLAKNKEASEAATVQAMETISKMDVKSILNGSRGSAVESAESIPVPVG